MKALAQILVSYCGSIIGVTIDVTLIVTLVIKLCFNRISADYRISDAVSKFKSKNSPH